MRTADPLEPNALYVGWRGDHEGRALDEWVEQVEQSKLAPRLVWGLSIDTWRPGRRTHPGTYRACGIALAPN